MWSCKKLFLFCFVLCFSTVSIIAHKLPLLTIWCIQPSSKFLQGIAQQHKGLALLRTDFSFFTFFHYHLQKKEGWHENTLGGCLMVAACSVTGIQSNWTSVGWGGTSCAESRTCVSQLDLTVAGTVRKAGQQTHYHIVIPTSRWEPRLGDKKFTEVDWGGGLSMELSGTGFQGLLCAVNVVANGEESVWRREYVCERLHFAPAIFWVLCVSVHLYGQVQSVFKGLLCRPSLGFDHEAVRPLGDPYAERDTFTEHSPPIVGCTNVNRPPPSVWNYSTSRAWRPFHSSVPHWM